MLNCLTRTRRIRATIAVVVAYSFCVLAPHAALAFTNSSAAMHCLTEISNLAHVHTQSTSPPEHAYANGSKHVHHDAAPVKTAQHTHGDGTSHDHGPPGKSNDGNCCGLFCISALHHDGVAALPAPPPRALAIPSPEAERTSGTLDRIYEPPIG